RRRAAGRGLPDPGRAGRVRRAVRAAPARRRPDRPASRGRIPPRVRAEHRGSAASLAALPGRHVRDRGRPRPRQGLRRARLVGGDHGRARRRGDAVDGQRPGDHLALLLPRPRRRAPGRLLPRRHPLGRARQPLPAGGGRRRGRLRLRSRPRAVRGLLRRSHAALGAADDHPGQGGVHGMTLPKNAKIAYGGDYNPEQWTEEIWTRDYELFGLARIDTVTLGVFDWALTQPSLDRYDFDLLDRIVARASAEGRQICLATGTGALPPWLAKLHPEVNRTDFEGRRHRYGQRHNA